MNAVLILGSLLFGIFLAECCYQAETWWLRRRARLRGIWWAHRLRDHERRRVSAALALYEESKQ